MTWPDTYFDLHVDYSARQIALRGELDAATAPCLATAVAAFERFPVGVITVDLGDVTVIDSAGLSAVATASCDQADKGSRLVVTGASAKVRRAFVLGKLAELLQPGKIG